MLQQILDNTRWVSMIYRLVISLKDEAGRRMMRTAFGTQLEVLEQRGRTAILMLVYNQTFALQALILFPLQSIPALLIRISPANIDHFLTLPFIDN
jgi:hypothetical protein